MKITTPFTILNQDFNEVDFIRHAINLKKNSSTERFNEYYRTMFKSDPCIIYFDEGTPTISNGYI